MRCPDRPVRPDDVSLLLLSCGSSRKEPSGPRRSADSEVMAGPHDTKQVLRVNATQSRLNEQHARTSAADPLSFPRAEALSAWRPVMCRQGDTAARATIPLVREPGHKSPGNLTAGSHGRVRRQVSRRERYPSPRLASWLGLPASASSGLRRPKSAKSDCGCAPAELASWSARAVPV